MKTEKELRSYQPANFEPSKIKHIHFLGICGTGMGALAGMLKQAGFLVTGSDQDVYPPMSTQLEKWGIEVFQGFSEQHLSPRPDLVIVGNACRPSNAEFQAAVAKEIPCTSMPRAIFNIFLKNRHTVVIAGTHGKTTTTALTAWILECAGMKPGLLVGGICKNFKGSFQLPAPDSKIFVIEGDEYDSALFDKVPKFFHYQAHTIVLTSVEFDHADIYANIEEVSAAFDLLFQRKRQEGSIFVCEDYPLATTIAQRNNLPFSSYSSEQLSDIHAKKIVYKEEGIQFSVFKKEVFLGDCLLPMFGHFNVSNALAAIAVADSFQVPFSVIQKALQTFQGIKRRQEIFEQIGDILLIDDFAHHPTSIQVTTKALRERFPNRRIWAIFEPRSNTARRHFFQDIYPESFSACDRILISQPFGLDKLKKEEGLDIEKVIESLKRKGKEALGFSSVENIVSYVTARTRPNDVIAILSNGGFENIHQRLAVALKERFTPQDTDMEIE